MSKRTSKPLAETNKTSGAGKSAARASKKGEPFPKTSDARESQSARDRAVQSAEVQAMAAASPFNANKPLEHGHDNAIAPHAGESVDPDSASTTASTSSE